MRAKIIEKRDVLGIVTLALLVVLVYSFWGASVLNQNNSVQNALVSSRNN